MKIIQWLKNLKDKLLKFLNNLLKLLWQKLKQAFSLIIDNAEELIIMVTSAAGIANMIQEFVKDKKVPSFFHDKYFLLAMGVTVVMILVEVIRRKYFQPDEMDWEDLQCQT